MLSKSDMSLPNANLYAVYLDVLDNVVGNLDMPTTVTLDPLSAQSTF
jgi:hypothetical protein